MADMTTEQRKAFFDEYGCYPVEESDVPVNERLVLTPEQVEGAAANELRMAAKTYLQQTDWYVTRKAEAGTAIPADILALRQQARADASS